LKINNVTISILLLFLSLSNTTVFSSQQQDSTLIRKTKKVKKSTSQKLLAAPQFIIKLPIKLLEYTTKGIVVEGVDGSIGKKIQAALSGAERIWVFYPIAGYGSNSGFKGGLGFRSKGVLTKDELFRVKGTYSINNYQSYKFHYYAPNFFHSDNGINFLFQYKKRPRESFYGSGNNSLKDNEVAFTLERSSFELGGVWTIANNFVTNLSGTYQVINLYDGENPGLEGVLDTIIEELSMAQSDIDPARIWSLDAIIKHDTRNVKGHPTKGGVNILSLSYNIGTDITRDLKFTNASIDIRRYFDLFRERVLYIRLKAQSLDRQGGSPGIPFYLQNRMGGVESLRGFSRGRFTGYDAALATMEYRYPIWDVIDAFLFLDEGRVFEDISKDFTFKDWKPSYGFGIRVWGVESTIFSFQTAFSKEGTRFYFQLSEKI